MRSGGIFDVDDKQLRFEEIELTLADPDIWNDPDNAKALNKERASLEQLLGVFERLAAQLGDLAELADLAAEEGR